MQVIVTVKLPKRADHDPTKKKRGTCPVFGGHCSDVTGQHHSGSVTDEGTLRWLTARYAVTRIEGRS